MTTTSMSLQAPIATTGSPQVGISTTSAPIQAPLATTSFVEPACEVEIDNANFIPDADIMQIVMKSCSRMNFAARMSVRLFDEETRLTHNVSGRGKPKLDPKRISFIKAKCFEMFPCHVTENIAAEWGNCVTAIDERSRRLKNKPNKKKPPLTMSPQQ